MDGRVLYLAQKLADELTQSRAAPQEESKTQSTLSQLKGWSLSQEYKPAKIFDSEFPPIEVDIMSYMNLMRSEEGDDDTESRISSEDEDSQLNRLSTQDALSVDDYL